MYLILLLGDGRKSLLLGDLGKILLLRDNGESVLLRDVCKTEGRPCLLFRHKCSSGFLFGHHGRNTQQARVLFGHGGSSNPQRPCFLFGYGPKSFLLGHQLERPVPCGPGRLAPEAEGIASRP